MRNNYFWFKKEKNLTECAEDFYRYFFLLGMCGDRIKRF